MDERKTIRILLVCNAVLVLLLMITFAGHMAYRRDVAERLAAIEQELDDAIFVSQSGSSAIENDVSRLEDLLLRLDEITVLVAEVRAANLEARAIDVRQCESSGDTATTTEVRMPLAPDCRFFVAGQFGLVPAPISDLPQVIQGGESPMTLIIINGRVVQICLADLADSLTRKLQR